MGSANNCNIPEDLYYLVQEHVWVRPEDDGTITIGMTDAAQALAGAIVTATPKEAGKSVKKGKSSGTVESGKWVGPIKSPVDGQIVAANSAIVANPKLLNQDPYGAGWFVRIQPSDWDAARAEMVTGQQAVDEYGAFLRAQGIDCAK